MNIFEKVKNILRKNKIKAEGPVNAAKPRPEPIPVPTDPVLKGK